MLESCYYCESISNINNMNVDININIMMSSSLPSARPRMYVGLQPFLVNNIVLRVRVLFSLWRLFFLQHGAGCRKDSLNQPCHCPVCGRACRGRR